MRANPVNTDYLLIDIFIPVHDVKSSFYTGIGKKRIKINGNISLVSPHYQNVKIYIIVVL